jgi:aryl-alcohol dehydrogenase-like predicted oxidoreductase
MVGLRLPLCGDKKISRLRLATARARLYWHRRPARLDPSVPIEETVRTIADLIKAGYVHHVGLQEVSVKQFVGRHRYAL